MSVKQVIKDFILLGALSGSIIVLVFVLYQFFQTGDVKMLYFGCFVVLFIVLGALARYRYVTDYIWTLFKSWR